MHITFVISSLKAGGAERVVSLLANAWVHKGLEATIITLDDSGENPFFEIDEGVKLLPLSILKDVKSPLEFIKTGVTILRSLRETIREENPDIVISFLTRTNISTILATTGLKKSLIVSERIHPKFQEIEQIWRILRNLLYPHMQSIVIQSKAFASAYSPKIRKKIEIIANPIDPFLIPKDDYNETKRVVAAGRLVRQKGFDLLIKAFAKVNKIHPDWKLLIWGDGPERENLQKQVEELGLGETISLPGKSEDIIEEFRNADIFVLSSRYEGFPNVLLEAMAVGTPCVSFLCPGAILDIIDHKKNGFLAPAENVNELAKCIEQLIESPELRKIIGIHAQEVKKKFALGAIIMQWQNLITRLLLENDKS